MDVEAISWRYMGLGGFWKASFQREAGDMRIWGPTYKRSEQKSLARVTATRWIPESTLPLGWEVQRTLGCLGVRWQGGSQAAGWRPGGSKNMAGVVFSLL
jgi:hypothetical protein